MPLSSEQFHTLYDGAAQPVVLVQDGAVAALNSCAQELFTVGTALCEYLPQDAELPETLYARPAVLPLLADGSEVLRRESWITNAYENLAFVTLGTIPHFTYLLPDTTDTVLAIEYKEDPQ